MTDMKYFHLTENSKKNKQWIFLDAKYQNREIEHKV
jgi:hypothetical protein